MLSVLWMLYISFAQTKTLYSTIPMVSILNKKIVIKNKVKGDHNAQDEDDI